jgi:PLP dependent protein
VTTVAARVEQVRARVASAAQAARRDPDDVLIVAVSKTHPPEVAQQAVDAGLLDLGENRVQELVAKRPLVSGAHWHLIGQLQRNKVKHVVGADLLVHSLDRRSLATAIDDRARHLGVVQRVLVQVNVGDDPAKSGCSLAEAGELVAYAADLPNLSVEGVMTIPPLARPDEDPATAARPHFAALRALRDELAVAHPQVRHLSMGMSADLDAAVAEGATIVRIGTAVFGSRGTAPWRPAAADASASRT